MYIQPILKPANKEANPNGMASENTPRLTYEQKQELSLEKRIAKNKLRKEKKAQTTGQRKAKKQNSEKNEPFQSLYELIKNFDEDKCLTLYESIRWKEGKACPKCGSVRVWQFKKNTHQFKCSQCDKQFNVRTGTIFEHSQIPLDYWFTAIFKESTSEGGITARELTTVIKVSLRTATVMLQKIRKVGCDQAIFTMDGTKKIQADHSFVGGLKRNAHIGNRDRFKDRKNKIPVMALVEENGIARAKSAANTKQSTVIKFVASVVPIYMDAVIFTDQATEFKILGKYYNHFTINHSEGQYAKDAGSHRVNTNTVEGFNSCMKTGFTKFRNYIPKKSIDSFINACVFRYNTRTMSVYEKLILALTNISLHAAKETKIVSLTNYSAMRTAA